MHKLSQQQLQFKYKYELASSRESSSAVASDSEIIIEIVPVFLFKRYKLDHNFDQNIQQIYNYNDIALGGACRLIYSCYQIIIMTVTAGRIPQCEHILYGSVTETNLPVLFHRLRGLCDYATEGGIPFSDREITLRIGGRGYRFINNHYYNNNY